MTDLFDGSQPVFDAAAVVLGLVIGSFLNVCIYRLPRDLSVVGPRSLCPACAKLIRWYDNIPLVSYLWLRGRCRSCGASISLRYPLVEAATAVVSWLCMRRFGPGWEYAVYFLYSAALLAVSVIDLDHRIIPDEISLPGAAAGLLLAALTPLNGFLDSLIGALIGGGFLLVVGLAYEGLRKQEGIGGGDIKLLAMVGAFTGWKGALFTIFGGSLIASILGIALMIARRADGKLPIPFGPFLSAASFVYILAGRQVLDAYWAWIHGS
ncbi:MAG: prepilin peptidase [bacterium]